MVKTLNVVDLYCGAGGLSLGFSEAVYRVQEEERARFKIVYAVDNNFDAIQTYRMSHFADLTADQQQTVAPCTDISNVTAETIRAATNGIQIDVVIGGPNCQGVSAAGLRNPGDKRNEMLLRFIEIVRDLRPRWFVMENVPGLTHANNRDLLEAIFRTFEEIPGYKISGDVLLAADYGVPQLRYRLFIIGTNTGQPIGFPIPTYKSPLADAQIELPVYVTVEQSIRDLEAYKPQFYDDDVTPAGNESLNHYCVRTEKINIQRIHSVPQGHDWRSMPIGLLPDRYFATRISDQKGAYGRLSWDWPAYTITNETSNVTAGPFTHPSQDRSLSVREAARLQTFPDTCVFVGRVMSQYTQIGNAVPRLLALAVAEAILACNEAFILDETRLRLGRLNLSLLQSVRENKMKFPVLTPRITNPAAQHKSKRTPTQVGILEQESVFSDIWNVEPRKDDPYPDQIDTLRLLAEQPANYKATKRAKAILQFIEGDPKEEIIAAAKVGEESVRKWINGYYAYGLNGWRAYYTPAERIANYDPILIRRIEESISKAREFNFDVEVKSPEVVESNRLHMNSYLSELRDRFGHLSVRSLIDKFEKERGYGIGTVYVSDLLAICGVLWDDDNTCVESHLAELTADCPLSNETNNAS